MSIVVEMGFDEAAAPDSQPPSSDNLGPSITKDADGTFLVYDPRAALAEICESCDGMRTDLFKRLMCVF
jgi:hypothetical protein